MRLHSKLWENYPKENACPRVTVQQDSSDQDSFTDSGKEAADRVIIMLQSSCGTGVTRSNNGGHFTVIV